MISNLQTTIILPKKQARTTNMSEKGQQIEGIDFIWINVRHSNGRLGDKKVSMDMYRQMFPTSEDLAKYNKSLQRHIPYINPTIEE